MPDARSTSQRRPWPAPSEWQEDGHRLVFRMRDPDRRGNRWPEVAAICPVDGGCIEIEGGQGFCPVQEEFAEEGLEAIHGEAFEGEIPLPAVLRWRVESWHHDEPITIEPLVPRGQDGEAADRSDHAVELVNCGHVGGCRCEKRPLSKVPCGHDTMALCRAALRVRDGRWYSGAATHVFADLLTELRNDGYVLARVEGQTGEQDV